MEKKDASLAKRLRAGRHDAADEFVDAYYEQIYLYLRRLGHGRSVSEDLTQDCFLQACQHIYQLRDETALKTWLYRIASNLSKRYWRSHKANNAVSLDEIALVESTESDYDKIELRERLESLKNAVAGLPTKFKQPIVLHYMQHLTIAEAAEAASMRQGTFKSRLNRALAKLRKQLS